MSFFWEFKSNASWFLSLSGMEKKIMLCSLNLPGLSLNLHVFHLEDQSQHLKITDILPLYASREIMRIRKKAWDMTFKLIKIKLWWPIVFKKIIIHEQHMHKHHFLFATYWGYWSSDCKSCAAIISVTFFGSAGVGDLYNSEPHAGCVFSPVKGGTSDIH